MTRLRAVLAALMRPESLTLAALLAGWALATWGFAWALRAPWLWPLSAGALLLGLAGYRPSALLLWEGPRGLWVRGQAMREALVASPDGRRASAAAAAREGETSRAREARLALERAEMAAELAGRAATRGTMSAQ